MSEGTRRIQLRIPIPGPVARAMKALAVSLALIFFAGLVFLLWAFQTGRAAEVARERIVLELKEKCDLGAHFETFRFAMFPPEATMRKLVLTQHDGTTLAAVEEAIVNVAVFPLFYGRVQLDRVAFLAPEASISLVKGRIENLPRCLLPEPAGPSSPEPSVPIALGVSDLQVERAKITVKVDDTLTAQLGEISVSLKPDARSGVMLAVGVDDGRILSRGKDLPLEHLRLLGRIAGRLVSPRALEVERFDVAFAGIQLHSAGSLDLLGPVYQGEVLLETPLSAVGQLFDDFPPTSGSLLLKTQVSGTLANPHGAGSLTIVRGRIGDYGTGDLAVLSFSANRRKIEVPALKIDVAEGGVSGTASLELGGRWTFRADLDTDRLSLGQVLDASGVKSAWVDFRATGKITASGHFDAAAKVGGKLDLQVRDFRTFDRGWDRPELHLGDGFDPRHVYLHLPETRVAAEWSADADAISIRGARLMRRASTATASARINFENRQGLDLVADFDRLDFSDLGLIAGVPIEGRGKLNATLRGPYYALRGHGKLELSGTRIAGVPLGDIMSDVDWHDDTVLVFNNLIGKLANSNYVARTRVDLQTPLTIDTRGEVTAGRLEDLLLPFDASPANFGHPRGIMTGQFDLAGPLRGLTGPVELELADVEVIGEKAEHGSVKGRFEKGALIFEELELEKRGGRISASGRLDPETSAIQGRAVTRGLRLSSIDALRASQPKLDGALEGNLEFAGTLRQVDGKLAVAVDGTRAGELPIGNGHFEGLIKSSRMALAGTLLDGDLSVDGEITIARGLPYRAQLKLSPYDLPRLIGNLGDAPDRTGEAELRAEVEGSLVDWQDSKGSVWLERATYDGGAALRLELLSPTRLDLDRGVLETKRLLIGGPDTRVQVVGKLGSRLTDLRVQGRIDLSGVPRVFAPIERSSGVLTLNAVVRRQGGELDLLGTGRVERGTVEWRALPSRFSGITANLSFSEATILIERAEARWAEGRVSASGQVLLDGVRPKSLAIAAKLEEVRPKFSYAKFDLTGTVNGDLTIEGPSDQLVMRGALAASRSLINPKLDWRSLVADPSQRASYAVYDPSKEVLTFDVGFHVDPEDPLQLRNDTAQVDLAGDVTMTGTNQRLGLLGELTVGRGRVGFIGREYAVEGGTLEFRDRMRFDPRYDLSLSARACDADIELNLTGTLDQVATSYHSKPEMEETNIVSCLIRGVKIKDLERIRGDTRSTAAASFAGEALWRLSGVDQEVRKVLPVDQVEVTTEYSTRERVYEPRILVAKEIQDGRFRLEYSSSLVKNDDQRAAVRYRITPRLTLQYGWASSDDMTIGDHGVDLKYRWEW